MVKWIREWATDPEVGVQVQVQVQMSIKEILEYSLKCVVEGLGMRVWKEKTPQKNQAPVFLTTPQKRKIPFLDS